MAYRSLIILNNSSLRCQKVTIGITGLWLPRVQINEILTVPNYHCANLRPGERAWQRIWGKKTLLSLTLVYFSELTRIV